MPCGTDKLKEQFDLLFKEILELQEKLGLQDLTIKKQKEEIELLKQGRGVLPMTLSNGDFLRCDSIDGERLYNSRMPSQLSLIRTSVEKGIRIRATYYLNVDSLKENPL